MSRNQKEKRKERKYILVEKRGRKLVCSKTDSLFDLRGEFDGYVTNSSPSKLHGFKPIGTFECVGKQH